MKPYVGAILTAAGTGTRLKAGRNKARVELGGKPLFAWALEALMASPCVGEVVMTVHVKDMDAITQWAAKNLKGSKPLTLAEGGATRQDSVLHGALSLEKAWDVVLVHDAARPFVTPKLIDACAKAAAKGRVALAAVPAKDSIKRLKGGKVESLKREELWAAQTPQALPAKAYVAAARKAVARGAQYTDECGLAEAVGIKPVLVEAGYENFKITTPEDLALAGLMIKRK